MSYIQKYKDIFNGKPFLRKGKSVTRSEYKAFDGGAIRDLLPSLSKELITRTSVTVLDYGSGTGIHWHKNIIANGTQNLPAKIGEKLQGFYRYDPAVEMYSKKPTGTFDFTFCTDVLEHIPDDELPEVLKDLNDFTNTDGVVFLSISTKLSANSFADGTNMHINIKTPQEWKKVLQTYIKRKIVAKFTNNQSNNLVSNNYRELLELEIERKGFGGTVLKKLDLFLPDISGKIDVKTILDYGAGSGFFRKHYEKTPELKSKYTLYEYEPGRVELSQSPSPQDYVICIDVLEHVEPDLIISVLNDLQRVVKKYGFFTIALTPAHRILPDGRNAHLLLKPAEWWLDRLKNRFKVTNHTISPKTLTVYVEKL